MLVDTLGLQTPMRGPCQLWLIVAVKECRLKVAISGELLKDVRNLVLCMKPSIFIKISFSFKLKINKNCENSKICL
jgi:hypothetical protein